MNLEYENFGRYESGRVVTHTSDLALVWAPNLYGGCNLVLVQLRQDNRAIRHGNAASIGCFAAWAAGSRRRVRRAYRRARRFLASHGIGRDWYVE